jgi:hypothetical protein
MAKTASQIVDYALTLVDEQVTDIADAASTEMSLRDMALQILPDVCRDFVKELPWELKRYLAESAVLVQDTLIDGESQSAYVKQKLAFEAPADFWELVSIRLKVWAKPVTSYILVDSSEYAIQNNPFARSGKQNPSVALSNTSGDSDARIECFSIEDGDAEDVSSFYYISFDNVPDDIGTTWPDDLFDEITKALASQLNIIKGRIDEAAIRGEEAVEGISQHE